MLEPRTKPAAAPQLRRAGAKRLIVTADDYGASIAVNEAVEAAHWRGILNTASLMVTGPAVDDAVTRAKAMPSLRVGLHLVLVDGRPVLPPEDVPDLLGRDGTFSTGLASAGLRFAASARVRRQLAAEIAAQFAAFRATGLVLDHVNAHHHMHLHPTVFRLMLEIGAGFGLRSVRLAHEPGLLSWRAGGRGLSRRLANDWMLRPLVRAQRRRLADAGIRFNDYLFGMHDAGRWGTDRLLRLLARLPDGVSELCVHPGAGSGPDGDPSRDPELSALTDIRAIAATVGHGIERITFSDLAAGPAAAEPET